MLMGIPPGRIVGSLIAAALLLGGCATTQIINQWSNPSYAAVSFKRILVIGVSKQTSIRRTFEDEFVAQLRAAGADAVPSYEFTPEDGPVEESLVRVERQAEYIPGTYGPYPGFGYYRWYSNAWVGFYEPPRLRFYDIYISETSLHDVRNDRLVWSGIAKTTQLGDIRQETKEFVEVVIAALREKNLLFRCAASNH
ncbi:MAG: hypothetical protein HYW03_05190 [Deltaproteobacteria bacterium]|nr:hypothetical protein [Deltaproteobacteria bacterium]